MRALFRFEFLFGFFLLSTMGGAVLFSFWIFPEGGAKMDFLTRLTPPFTTMEHPLGTDTMGRDILARVVVGGKVSFIVGIFSALGAIVLGTISFFVARQFKCQGVSVLGSVRLRE